MAYTADSIRIVRPDSISIRFERKRPIRRSVTKKSRRLDSYEYEN